MKRVDAFKYCLNNLVGILEVFNANLLSRVADESKLEKTEQRYVNKLKDESINIYEALQATVISLVKQSCNAIAEFYSEKQMSDFLFILCGLCDETIIDSYFSNNESWKDYLVERAIFNTSVSGEQVFVLINNFIQIHSSKDNELAYVYYYMLCLGYKGMYKKNVKEIAFLKQNLLNMIVSDYVMLPVEKLKTLSPATMQHTIKTQAERSFVNYRTTYRNIFTSVFGIHIFIILGIWIWHINYKLALVK